MPPRAQRALRVADMPIDPADHSTLAVPNKHWIVLDKKLIGQKCNLLKTKEFFGVAELRQTGPLGTFKSQFPSEGLEN